MISDEFQREILRLYHAEKWRPGSIAAALGVHFVTVKRVLEQEGIPAAKIQRPSKIDPYLSLIHSTLERFPMLTAARLFGMVRERGYTGKPSHFRDVISKIRPPKSTEAYFRLRTSPGDQGQVDWGHFGKVQIGQAKRPLMAFVIVLSYSRAIFLRFFPGQHMNFFLEGHQQAFERWKGCPRNLLYDNLKSVVISRPSPDSIEFNKDFSEFASHHRFRPVPVGVRRGNEKGRVERAIRYVRTSFFAARSFRSLEDLNEQADRWSTGHAMERPWPEDRQSTVLEAYDKEAPLLLPLRETRSPCAERKEVRVPKTPYVRFDRNDYSVPHTHVRKLVVVHADLDTVRISSGDEVIASHKRSFDANQTIEDRDHIEQLKQEKKRAGKARRTDVVLRAVPSAEKFLKRAIENRVGAGLVVRHLRSFTASYGSRAVERAICEALTRGVFHPHGLRHILETERIRKGEPAALPIDLPDDQRVRDLHVRPHSLDDYDGLTEDGEIDE